MLDFQDGDTRRILEPYRAADPEEQPDPLDAYDLAAILEDFVKLTLAAQANLDAIESAL